MKPRPDPKPLRTLSLSGVWERALEAPTSEDDTTPLQLAAWGGHVEDWFEGGVFCWCRLISAAVGFWARLESRYGSRFLASGKGPLGCFFCCVGEKELPAVLQGFFDGANRIWRPDNQRWPWASPCACCSMPNSRPRTYSNYLQSVWVASARGQVCAWLREKGAT